MKHTYKYESIKAGLPPGSLIHVGKRLTDKVKVSVIDYSSTHFDEELMENINACLEFQKTPSVSWINIDGLHDISLIEKVGQAFDLHPLLLEDILNTQHRPSFEEFDNCIAVSLKMIGMSENNASIVSEQISIVLGTQWIITFQEQEGDIFDGFRQRIRENKGVIRKQSVDYLFYRLLDTVVDNYFFITEHFNDSIENLEQRILNTQDREVLEEIQRLKRMLIGFRRSVFPVRELLLSVQRDNTKFIKNKNNRFFVDVYEHVIQLMDNLEYQREMLSNIMDLYHTEVNNRMNQVMQVLTIIATIFIPLTFIAGIYGMNFENMPELKWKYGYQGVWGLMLIVIVVMIIYFKRKKWL
jgi:magnesium transporter